LGLKNILPEQAKALE
jgi:hypothetical protein